MRRFLLIASTLCILTGCATTIDLSRMDQAVMYGTPEESLARIEKDAPRIEHKQGPIVRALDVGMVYHWAGELDGSNQQLDEAEQRISAAYTKSVSRSAASFVLNDNTKEYPGEDFEDVYLNVFKSLNYYRLGSTLDAMVEIRRSEEKQQNLRTIYEGSNKEGDTNIAFTHSALSDWLGFVYSDMLGEHADKDYFKRRVGEAFQSGLYDTSVPQDSLADGNLKVLAFSGLEPLKLEEKTSLLMPSGNFLSIAIPYLEKQTTRIAGVEIVVDGESRGLLDWMESLSLVAINTFELKQSGVVSKAILRATGKLVTSDILDMASYDSAQNEHYDSSLLFSFLSLVNNIFTLASERADTRMSHYLPSEAWTGSFTLDEGVHEITLRYLDGNGALVGLEHFPHVEVKTDMPLLLESHCLR